MAVTSAESGITDGHIAAIQKVCQDMNVFLLVRPSTADTARLIDEGYATKSMDIHDKSSDWGPMAGFVPCDPYFSKKLIGSPNADMAKPADHGEAKAVQLRLTDRLAQDRTRLVSVPAPVPAPVRNGDDARRGQVTYVQAKSGDPAMLFELEKDGASWKVYWVHRMSGQPGKPVPLLVWGYQVGGEVKPVTGDYDLWLVAPHISQWSQHVQVMGVQDSHGESGATMFITYLLQCLNAACGRSASPVFNHGAEAQNYGFTQAIDSQLVMFSPSGCSEMVDRTDLPAVLTDMQYAGYLVYWNKRYGERDPELMGKAFFGGVAGGGADSLDALIEEAAAVKRGAPTDSLLIRELKASKGVQKHLLGKDNEALKVRDIRGLHERLQTCLKDLDTQGADYVLKKLKPQIHLPKTVVDTLADNFKTRQALQQQLQAEVIRLSEMDRGMSQHEGHTAPTAGATLSPRAEKWEDWLSKPSTVMLLTKLRALYGTEHVPLRFDRIPGTRAYKAIGREPAQGANVAQIKSKMGLS